MKNEERRIRPLWISDRQFVVDTSTRRFSASRIIAAFLGEGCSNGGPPGCCCAAEVLVSCDCAARASRPFPATSPTPPVCATPRPTLHTDDSAQFQGRSGPAHRR